MSKCSRRIIAKGEREKRSGLYQLVTKTPPTELHQVEINLTSAALDLTRLWHHRLGHLSYQILHQISASGTVTGLPYLPILKEVCSRCQYGCQTRESFPSHSQNRASKPLQLLHIDLCGPMQTMSLGGNYYFVVVVDDFSRYVWVKLLREKFQGVTTLIKLITLLENQLTLKVGAMRSDRGGEFLAKFFIAFCNKKGSSTADQCRNPLAEWGGTANEHDTARKSLEHVSSSKYSEITMDKGHQYNGLHCQKMPH
jgi:hypothetical protein